MSNLIGRRIKYLREKRGFTQTQLARLVNIGKSTLSEYESGKANPTAEVIRKIADVLDVSADYLLGLKDTYEKFNEVVEIDVPEVVKYIPLYEVEVSAGNGTFPNGFYYSEAIPITFPNIDYAFKVMGDSMEPLIANGSVVLVKATPIADSGKMIVCLYDDLILLKWFYKNGSNIVLLSENPAYPPIVVNANRRFQIIGTVESNINSGFVKKFKGDFQIDNDL